MAFLDQAEVHSMKEILYISKGFKVFLSVFPAKGVKNG